MRSMFAVGFDREVFSVRHPSMGISISDLESFWKANYPQAKADLKPFLTSAPTAPVPAGTPVPLSPTNLAVPPRPIPPTPSDSGGSSTLLWVGALAVVGVGGWYAWTHKKELGFGSGKKK